MVSKKELIKVVEELNSKIVDPPIKIKDEKKMKKQILKAAKFIEKGDDISKESMTIINKLKGKKAVKTTEEEPAEKSKKDKKGKKEKGSKKKDKKDKKKKAATEDVGEYGFAEGSKRDKIATLMATGKYTKEAIQQKCDINYSLGKTIKALRDNGHTVEVNDKGKVKLS